VYAGAQPSRPGRANGAEKTEGAAETETPAVTQDDITASYKQLNDNLNRIYESLPMNTAFVVLSGHSDPRLFTALTAKKNKFDSLFKTGTPISTMPNEDKWMEQDDRALQSAVHRVREGMTFLAIKR
jgi:RNA exonuclease 1